MINQEFFKEHENLKHHKVYRKITLPSGNKTAPLAVSFHYSLECPPWVDIL